jgi:hypothetical protein
MDINRKQILKFTKAMNDYDILLEKDKEVKVTEERMIQLSSNVKYTILWNRGKIKNETEAQAKVLEDKFRELGGLLLQNGMVTFMDLKESEKLKEKHKDDKTKLKPEIRKLRDNAEENGKKYSDWEKEYLDEKPPKAKAKKLAENIDLRGIKPTEHDIQILPDSLISIYLELNLCAEPVEDEKGEVAAAE